MPTTTLPKPNEDKLFSWAVDLVARLTDTLGAIWRTIDPETVLTMRRFAAPTGTVLVAGNVVIGAGWGAGATFIVAGNDQRGSVTVTAAGVPAANATITITYTDGAWRVTPFAVACRSDINVATGSVSASTTTTVLTLTNHALPVAGTAYTISWVVMG